MNGACLAAHKNWVAARDVLLGAYEAGCRHSLCLQWLSAALMTLGQIDAARSVLLAWRQAEPTAAQPPIFLEALERAAVAGPAAGPQEQTLSVGGKAVRVDSRPMSQPAAVPASATAPNPANAS